MISTTKSDDLAYYAYKSLVNYFKIPNFCEYIYSKFRNSYIKFNSKMKELFLKGIWISINVSQNYVKYIMKNSLLPILIDCLINGTVKAKEKCVNIIERILVLKEIDKNLFISFVKSFQPFFYSSQVQETKELNLTMKLLLILSKYYQDFEEIIFSDNMRYLIKNTFKYGSVTKKIIIYSFTSQLMLTMPLTFLYQYFKIYGKNFILDLPFIMDFKIMKDVLLGINRIMQDPSESIYQLFVNFGIVEILQEICDNDLNRNSIILNITNRILQLK